MRGRGILMPRGLRVEPQETGAGISTVPTLGTGFTP